MTGGLLALAGVILAHVWRKDASDNPLSTRFDKQISVFCITLLLTVIGVVLTLILVGYLILIAAGIYTLVMSIIRAHHEMPWP